MPEVSAQERQALKQQSAQMAITDANISQWLAASSAVVALFSPPHGAVLAVGAAAIGVCGNYRQQVANDPPRDDYDQVWITGGEINEPAIPADEPTATITRFAAQQMIVTDALYALLRSLERYDGASNVGDAEGIEAQVSAVQQNAEIAANAQETLASVASQMNHAVASLRANSPGYDAITIESAADLYRESWGEPAQNPGATLQQVTSCITGVADDLLEPFDPVEAHPILSASELPEDRSVVFDQYYLDMLAENSATLRRLVIT